MITGLELALAILPLLVSATEHHKKGLRFGRVLFSTKGKNEQQLIYYYELYDELSLLENTLKGVLRDLPSRSADQELSPLTVEEEKQLERVLGNSAKPFNQVLERLLKSLNDLVSEKSLELNRADVSMGSSSEMLSRLERFRQAMNSGVAKTTLRDRFRFTRNEKSWVVAMAKIREANKSLERLLQTSLLINVHEFHRPTPKKPRRERLRRMSEPLYGKIVGKLTTACDTHNLHEARLCLWNCCSDQRRERPTDSIDMVVSVTDVEKEGSHWQESIFLIPSAGDQARPSTTVQFNIDGEDDVEGVPPPPIPPGRDIESVPLCNLIQRAHFERAALQIVFERGRLWQTKSRSTSLRLQKQKGMTLKELLEASPQYITLRDKWILAVVLAHAALHGSGSPWLYENWSKEHISFFKKDVSMTLDLRRPFLKIQLDETPENINDARNYFRVHSDSSLLSLGILLLEVVLAEPIESKYAEEDLIDNQPNENTNLTTALRLLESLEDEVCEGYRAAVRACLDADMDMHMEAADFGSKVYEKIVLPLEHELAHAFHMKPEEFRLAPEVF